MIKPRKLEDFKRLNAKCAEVVRTKDAGTLQYESYMNSNETGCIVLERDSDSQALLDHHKHLGETMAEILETCEGSGRICGTSTAELTEHIKGSPIQIHSPLPSNLDIEKLRT